MTLPKSPLHCDVCDANTMDYTMISKNDKFEEDGLFILPININDEIKYLHPVTALCSQCGQVKIFFDKDKLV